MTLLAEEGLRPDPPAATLSRPWVDHALRHAGCVPRTADRYGEPAAVAAATAAWGARVQAAAAAQRGEVAAADATAAAAGDTVADSGADQ